MAQQLAQARPGQQEAGLVSGSAVGAMALALLSRQAG
jgi:hypothetical protein